MTNILITNMKVIKIFTENRLQPTSTTWAEETIPEKKKKEKACY